MTWREGRIKETVGSFCSLSCVTCHGCGWQSEGLLAGMLGVLQEQGAVAGLGRGPLPEASLSPGAAAVVFAPRRRSLSGPLLSDDRS